LIELQIHRRMTLLKSKATQEYLCYRMSEHSGDGGFVMTHLNNLTRYCVFTFETKYMNEYKFSIGSVENRLVHLAFDRVGHLIYNNNLADFSANTLKCKNSTLFILKG